MKPLISIIAPCYNHRLYVRDALNSVLEQTYDNLELIIIDDGSTDGSVEEISSTINTYRGNMKVIFHTISNSGAHSAINLGLSLATGQIIGIINTDDLYTPDRITLLSKPIIEGQTHFTFSKVGIIDQNSKPLRSRFANRMRNIQNSTSNFPTIGFASIINNVTISTGNFLFSKHLLDRVGEFKPFRYCHDWDFLLRSLKITEPIQIDSEEYLYRSHGSNSYLKLQDLAKPEGESILRSFFLDNPSGSNGLFPSELSWPYYFPIFIKKYSYLKEFMNHPKGEKNV